MKRQSFSTTQATLMMVVLLFATFAGSLMQTSLGTALPTLMRSFDITFNIAQEATTYFLLTTGIMIPFSAYLTTKFPTKWLYIAAYSILLIGMIISVMTPSRHTDWGIFLLGRVIAAIAVGIMLPMMQIVVIELYPAKKRSIAMGAAGLVIGLAPAIGPTLAGWILDRNHIILGLPLSKSWRTIFLIPIGFIVIALLVSPFVIKNVIPNRPIHLDIISLILSSFGFGLFLLGFTNVGTDGWKDFNNVIFPILIGLVIIIGFILRQLKLTEPFLNVRVFSNMSFTTSTITLIFVTTAMYGVEMMLPTYLQDVHGLSTLQSGLTLLPGAICLGIISPISGIIYNKVGIKRLAAMGFIILALGTLPFSFLSPSTPDSLIIALYATRLIGVGFIMMPLITNAMNALGTAKAANGIASNNTARKIASSISVAVLTSLTQSFVNTDAPNKILKIINPLAYTRKVLANSMNGFRASFLTGFIFAIIGLCSVVFLTDESEVSEIKNG